MRSPAIQSSRSIRTYLMGVALVLALPLVAVTVHNVVQDVQTAQAQAQTRLRGLSRTMADHTAQRIQAARQVLERLARRPLVQKLDASQCDPVLQDMHGLLPGFSNVVVTDLTGQVVCSVVAQPGGKRVDVGPTPWFSEFAQAKVFSVGQPHRGPITGKMVSVLSYPVLDARGQMSGGVHLPLDLHAFDPGINAQDLSNQSRFGLFDGDGYMIWRNSDPEGVIGKRPNADAARRIVAVRDGEFAAQAVDDVVRFFAVSPVKGTDWVAFVGVPLDEVQAAPQQQAWVAGGISLVALLVLAWLIARLAARVQEPVQALARVVHGIGEGQHHLRATPQGPAELVEVAMGFNRLMDERLGIEANLEAQRRELQRAHDMRDEALRVAQLGMWRCTLEPARMHCDAHLCKLLGVDPAAWADIDLDAWVAHLHPEDVAQYRQQVLACMHGKSDAFDGVARIRHALGHWVWGRWRGKVLTKLARGRALTLIGSFQDVTSETEHADQLRLAASVFTHAREGITITDPRGSILTVNDSFTQITGYAAAEVRGKNPRVLQSGVQGPEFYQAMWAQLVEHGHWSGEIWNQRKNGERYVETLTISAVHDAQGRLQHYVGMFTDISRQRESERLLAHAAHYDALTGLPNRNLLTDRLEQAMHQCQRRQCSMGVAYLDLDGFKAYNDQHGHEKGDTLLLSVAQRLKAVLREDDTLARLGGDEFAVVLVDLPNGGDCLPVLQRLLDAAAVDVQGTRITASMGVTFYPDDGVEADVLLRHADQAMFLAKQAGRNRYHLFDLAQDVAVRTRHESLEGVRRALEQGELVLHYQPKVHMRSGVVVGCEALIRWQHPEKGLLYPGAFLPTIENLPISIELGEWVIATALNQAAQWCARGRRLAVSVNISAYQLMHPDFEQRLSGLLGAQTQVPPELLQIEVLETSALEDVEHVATVMQRCRGLGVRFALDDFGTGYSSLTYLKRLPAECIKIDQSFVRDMLHDAEDLAIVKGVIGLARAFNREVIAEGVETTEHGAVLLQLGCEHAQGWGIARAMPAHAWDEWMAHWSSPAAWQ